MFKLDIERAEEPEIKLPTFIGSLKKQESSRKNLPLETIYHFDYVKAFDYMDHNKLWKIFQEMGISDYLTCLLRNLYAGQEGTVRTGHGMVDSGKVYIKAVCISSPCLINVYAEYIM